MRVVVDRIEGDRVIVEVDGVPSEVASSAAPAGVTERSVWEVDAWPPATPWRLIPAGDSEAEALLARLRSRTPQRGDIDL